MNEFSCSCFRVHKITRQKTEKFKKKKTEAVFLAVNGKYSNVIRVIDTYDKVRMLLHLQHLLRATQFAPIQLVECQTFMQIETR